LEARHVNIILAAPEAVEGIETASSTGREAYPTA
jgi:hypothetical protein